MNNKLIFCIENFGKTKGIYKLNDFSYTLIESIRYHNWLNKTYNFDFITIKITDIEKLKQKAYRMIPIGSNDFVLKFLNVYYNIKTYKPINIPSELNNIKYLKRNLYYDFKKNIKLNDFKFIKNVDKIKNYLNITNDINELNDNDLYLVSDVVDIISEYRCFIFNKTLLDIKNYLGDFKIFPNINLINNMIDDYKSSPIAYTLDVGINDKGETLLIEIHDFFSCGLYGFSNLKKLCFMYITWFNEFVNKNADKNIIKLRHNKCLKSKDCFLYDDLNCKN